LDLDDENHIDNELRDWLAFPKQKLQEACILERAVLGGDAARKAIEQNRSVMEKEASFVQDSRSQRLKPHEQCRRTEDSTRKSISAAQKVTGTESQVAPSPDDDHWIVSADQGSSRGKSRIQGRKAQPLNVLCPQMTFMVSRSAVSFHLDVEAAADAAPFSVATAHVFAAFAASIADAAVPSAVFSRHPPSAATR